MSVGDAVAYAGHPNGIAARSLMVLQPARQVGEHLVVILELGIHAEAVTTCGIDKERALVASTSHSRVIGYAVGHRRHSPVVVGKQDDGRRSEVSAHGIEVGVLLHQLLVVLQHAQKTVH